MAMAQVTCVVDRLKAWPRAVSLTYPPRNTAPSVNAAPTIDASTTLPGRSRYIHRPTSRAMGIVQAIVNVPQDEPGTRRTDPAGMAASVCHGMPTSAEPGAGSASAVCQFIGAGVFSGNDSLKVIDCPPH